MVTRRITRQHAVLLVGDIITLALVTVLGFSSHRTLETAGTRVLTTFIPLIISWLLVAPFLGAYDLSRAFDARQLWRPFWAMVLASPLAAWMRGAWLNSPILPIFVVVLGGVSAIGMLVWRALFLFTMRGKG
jgi:hypothetical protein